MTVTYTVDAGGNISFSFDLLSTHADVTGTITAEGVLTIEIWGESQQMKKSH